MSSLAPLMSVTPLHERLEVVALALVVCGLIFELVRRRRLMERYAILWLLAGLTVLVLAVWKGLLTTIAHAIGISYPPTVLFAVAFLFVLVMLVHFSIAISRLADRNTMLAQRLALTQQRLDELRGDAGGEPTSAPASETEVAGGSGLTGEGEDAELVGERISRA